MRNILFVVIMLSAASGCGGLTVKGSGKNAMTEADAISKWIGSYDSVSGRCGEVLVQESKITWGSCKEAGTKLVSVSASEWVMEVDPLAVECGWAGFIVALEEGGESRKNATSEITISAYQNMEDYKAANRFVQCAYLMNNR